MLQTQSSFQTFERGIALRLSPHYQGSFFPSLQF